MGEETYLAPLDEIVESGKTQADRWIARFEGAWGGDAAKIFAEAEV